MIFRVEEGVKIVSKKLYVGSLSYNVTNAQLEELFSQAGKVESANVITDRYSGQGRGFGFVEMSTEEEAKKAIEMFNGYNLNGRNIIVDEARPKKENPRREQKRGDFRRSGFGRGGRR